MVTPGGGRQVAVSIDTGQTACEQRVEASIQCADHGLTPWQRVLSMSAVAAVMSRKEPATTLDPDACVGLAPLIVDRVLARVRTSGWLER
jgi:hypothetical protein